MIPTFEWSTTDLLTVFVVIAVAIPAIIMYFDTDTWEHFRGPGHQ